jgi:hypothetical protein
MIYATAIHPECFVLRPDKSASRNVAEREYRTTAFHHDARQLRLAPNRKRTLGTDGTELSRRRDSRLFEESPGYQ